MIKFFKNIQIFLKFVNFYRRFIARFFQLSTLLLDRLKKMQAKIKKEFFLLIEKAKQIFDLLRNVFQYVLILTHFDSKFLIKLKTNAFDYEIVDIISQLQFDEQWRLVAFFSRKMIFAEMNYETHDQKLLIIVECFKHWRHYFKKNYHTMKVFIDHNNLKDFMNVKTLNERQIKWAMRLISFDFIIKHRFEEINFVDDSSRRFDYHDVNTKIIRFLLVLQTKLRIVVFLHIQFSNVRAIIVTLSAKISRIVFDENEISRSKIAIFVSISVLSEKRRECDELTQCVSRAIIAILLENEIFYENNFEFILNLIKILQKKNVFVQTRLKNIETSNKRQRDIFVKSDYILKNDFLKFRERYYVFEKKFLRIKLLKRHHDDILTNYFDVKKTIELFNKKYYWSKMIKYVKFYIKTCNICQRTMTFKHFSYDDLQSFFLFQNLWQKIIMNFITNFSFNKRSNNVYDSVLVIINRYIKMTLYIFVTKKIIAIELTNIIFDQMMLKYDASKDVVSNREFVFTSAYWTNICYHMKMKRRLNIVFHSQIDDQTKRQNQNLKHFLRVFCFEKQIEWIKFLLLIEFVYQNSVQFIIECSLFFCMYDYNSEIRYESKDDIIMKEVLVVTKRVKEQHEYRQKLIEKW